MLSFLNRFHALPDSLKGVLMLMIAAAGFSLIAALIKWVGAHLHVTQILFLRQMGMIIIIAPSLIRRFPNAMRTQRLGLQLLRVGFALIAMLTGFTAVIHLPLADATAISFAKSFFVTIFAIIILREVVGPRRWGATVVGFLGVLVMVQPGTQGFSLYGVYAIVGAAAAAVVMVIIRLLSRSESPATIMSYQAIGVAIAMLIPAVLFWQPPTLTEWILVMAIGVLSYFAQKANIYAFKWGEASMLASLDYVRLIYTTALGMLIFGQLPSLETCLGAVIVVSAAIYTVHRETVRRRIQQG